MGEKASVEMVGRLSRYTLTDGVPRWSLFVALIVGTILNLIHQGDALGRGVSLDVVKLLLYLVLYYVSTYGAVSYRLHAARRAANRSS
jgi:hypothetical protein